MSDDETLSREASLALDSERFGEAIPPAVRARLSSRLEASLAAAGALLPGHGASHFGELAGAEPNATSRSVENGLTGATRSVGVERAAHVTQTSTWLAKLSTPFVAMTIGFGVGAGAGFGAHAVMDRRDTSAPASISNRRESGERPGGADAPLPRAKRHDVPITSGSNGRAVDGVPFSPVTTPRKVEAAPMVERKSVEAHVRPSPAAARTGGASALLSQAQAALARGRAEDALHAIERHRSAYPSHELAEERDVLAIRAEAMLGRREQARERAARFLARYPDSIHRAIIETYAR